MWLCLEGKAQNKPEDLDGPAFTAKATGGRCLACDEVLLKVKLGFIVLILWLLVHSKHSSKVQFCTTADRLSSVITALENIFY